MALSKAGFFCKDVDKMTKTNWGGRRPGAGRPRKPLDEKYRGIYVKLPPALLEWLRQNTENRNGFIVEAIKEKIRASK